MKVKTQVKAGENGSTFNIGVGVNAIGSNTGQGIGAGTVGTLNVNPPA